VFQAGEPYGIRVIAPSEARRIEAGIFNYGSDLRVEDTPLHVTGLEKYVEWDQEADFIGRQRLEEIRDGDLLDRKLVGVEIGGDPMTDEGALNDIWPLFKGDARLGRITAGAWSPRLEKNVGYAWVPIRWVGGAGLGVRGRDAARARPGDRGGPALRRSGEGHPEVLMHAHHMKYGAAHEDDPGPECARRRPSDPQGAGCGRGRVALGLHPPRDPAYGATADARGVDQADQA
jgi:hypothetical protein